MKKMIVLLLMFIGFNSNAQLCMGTSSSNANSPNGIAYGDFNGDSFVDIAVSSGTNSVFVFNGNISGTFSSSPNYTITTNHQCSKIVMGNFNADNFNDLAVGNQNSAQISVLISNGSGSFSTAVTYTVPTFSTIKDMYVSNFNIDSYNDIIATSSGASSAYIIYGSNNFSPTYSLSGSSTGVAPHVYVGNLNSDNYPDFVLSSAASNSITICLGSPSGTFSGTNYGVGTNRADCYLAYINNDNFLDIVVSTITSSNIKICLNNGSGVFTTINTHPSGNYRNIVCADFNGDGNTDVAGVTGTGNTLEFMFGTGTGTFSTVSGINTYTSNVFNNVIEIETIDLDLNGKNDFAITSLTNNRVLILKNGISLNSNVGWSLCNGNSATLTVYGASSYTWIGGANTTTIVTPTSNTSYSLSGSILPGLINNYSVTVSGCTTSIVKTITVHATPNISVSGTNPICSGDNSTLTASGALSYTWTTPTGTVVSSAIVVGPNINTTYSVTGINTNCSSTSSFVLAVNPSPLIVISGSNAVCSGSSASLTASGASTYTWTSPTNSVGSTLVVNPTVNTTYFVSGTNTNGCVGYNAKLVSVNPLPTISISGPSIVCAGVSTSLVANGASTYTWTSPTNSIVSTLVVNPTVNTTYYLVGNDVNSCSNSTLWVVNVNPLPIVSISGTSVMCSGNTATLSASGAATYAWSNTSTLSSIIVVPNTTTTYSVIGVDGNGCINSASHTVVVNATPTLSLNGASVVCLGESSTLTISGADTYTWNDGSNLSNLVINPTSNSTYSVVGLSNNGCSSSAAITVSVSECVGVVQNTKQSIGLNVYPNPNNGEFTIQSENDLTVKIVNQLGQVVYSDVLSAENNKKINVSNLPVGLYYVVCSDGQSSVSKAVIVK